MCVCFLFPGGRGWNIYAMIVQEAAERGAVNPPYLVSVLLLPCPALSVPRRILEKNPVSAERAVLVLSSSQAAIYAVFTVKTERSVRRAVAKCLRSLSSGSCS